MPAVFRKTYTAPIPPGAECITIERDGEKVPAVRFKGPNRKWIVAPLTRTGDRCLMTSPTWYGWVGGKAVRLSPNKVAAEQMLAELVKRAELGKAGVRDGFEVHRKKPLAEHLEDYRRSLEARGNHPRYVEIVIPRITALLEGCAFTFTNDLSASRVMDWLADLRQSDRPNLDPGQEWYTRSEVARILGVVPRAVPPLVKRHQLAAVGHTGGRRFPRATVEALLDRRSRGASVETSNQYLRHLKSFCLWLVKDRRMPDNPLAHLESNNARVDRRHDRRELEAEELRRLLTAARASVRTFRGLTGPDRFHLYATACGTGFRAGGLASLTPESFDLAGAPPVVTLAARRNKSRVLKVQPLPPDVADLLADYLKDRPAGQPVWPGPWARKGAEMLRGDLEAAGIPYAVEGPDGPLYADFHSLRHTYLTLGARAGIDLRTLQELAGHSSPVLTARYSHRRLYDLAGAVERLPSFLPSNPTPEAHTLRATGTDAGPPAGPCSPCSTLAVTVDSESGPVRIADGTGRETPPPSSSPNPCGDK